MDETSPETFAALWPGGASAIPPIPPAPRPPSLSGRRIAFLWDHVFRGEEIFPELERALGAAFDDVELVGYEHFGSTFGGDEHAVLRRLPERLRELAVDAVVSGVGA